MHLTHSHGSVHFRKNDQSSNGRRIFDGENHNLQEYTYKKITPCDVCSQVLRGKSLFFLYSEKWCDVEFRTFSDDFKNIALKKTINRPILSLIFVKDFFKFCILAFMFIVFIYLNSGHTRQGLRCRNCKSNVHVDCAAQLTKCQAKQKLLRRQKSTSEIVTNRIDLDDSKYMQCAYWISN